MNGIALAVIVSQLPKLCGISIDGRRPAGAGAGLRCRRCGRAAQCRAPSASARRSLALILLLKRWPRVPGMLIAIAGATAAVALLRPGRQHGVSVLGTLPQGLPSPSLPWIGWADLLPVLGGALAVALVAFADTSVLSRTYAQRAAHAGRPEPGDGGAGRDQPGGRPVPGLSDQQQLVAHAGGRGRRCAHRR